MQEIVAYFFPILLFFSILGRTNGFTNRSICWLEWPGSEVQRPLAIVVIGLVGLALDRLVGTVGNLVAKGGK